MVDASSQAQLEADLELSIRSVGAEYSNMTWKDAVAYLDGKEKGWLLFVDKRSLDWRAVPRAMLYPLAYGAWTLAHGAATGWYPYPFVDVVDLGYVQALANMTGLFVVLAVLDATLIAVGRRIGPTAT